MPRSVAWPERNLIPYEASRFDARSVLVVAPHPDDEVFGCGGALVVLRRSGASVRVLVVTDGAADEPDPTRRRQIAERRLAESRMALDLLGGGALEVAGLPDRDLFARAAEVRSALSRSLLAGSVDLVFVPSPCEIHPDHRAVAEAFFELVSRPSRELAQALPRLTVAFYEVSQPIRPNFLVDVSEVADVKDRAMAAFDSQNGQRDYPGFIRGLNAYRRMTLGPEVRAAEGFFVLAASELSRVALEEVRAGIGPGEPLQGVRRRERTLFERLTGLRRKSGL